MDCFLINGNLLFDLEYISQIIFTDTQINACDNRKWKLYCFVRRQPQLKKFCKTKFIIEIGRTLCNFETSNIALSLESLFYT